MKTNSIIGRTDQILDKNGKTLDKMLESSGGGKGPGTPNYVAMLWDDDNPPFGLGQDPVSGFNSIAGFIYLYSFPIQFVFTSSSFYNSVCDVTFPPKVSKNSMSCDFTCSLIDRKYNLHRMEASYDGESQNGTMYLDWLIDGGSGGNVYKSLTTDSVSVDVDKKTITYTYAQNEFEVTTIFDIFYSNYQDKIHVKPYAIEVNPDGTKLAVYPTKEDKDSNDPIVVAIASQSVEETH